MSLSAAASATLRAVAATLVGDAADDLAERVAARIRALPRRADRDELDLLLRLLDRPLVNLLLSGIPRPFRAMSHSQRERCLRGWAASRLPLRRKAFQALKRLVTVTHYTSPAATRVLGYPGPLGPPAAPSPAAKPIQPITITGDTTLTCDVVIVGSGAGGGVVAAELAGAGLDVVVLEKGGYHTEPDFTHHEGDALASLYDAGGLRTTRDLALVVLQGSTLGGGTVINYTTSFATPAAVRDEWAARHGLPHFTEPEYSRSLEEVARRVGANTDHARPSGRDQVLVRGLEALGWHHGLLPRNVRACPQDDGCGYCGFGCRTRAKQSTLLTFLQDAYVRGARFVVGCEAHRVTFAPGGGRGGGGAATGVEARVERHAVHVRARAVVVAAGAIHSPALLLRSGLRLPALGRHLALHPATAVFGEMPEDVRPWSGTVQAHYSDQFADLGAGFGFKIETAPLHPGFHALAAPWESAVQFSDRMRRLPRTALCGILLRDRGSGRVRVDGEGAPVVDYRLAPADARNLRRGLEAGAELLEAAGAREIWAPLARSIPYRPANGGGGGAAGRRAWLERVDAAGWGPNQLLLVTFHQMASCRMGTDVSTSVVDAGHRVFGVRGLYVADAGVFPSASGVNPMLTVMGIAHRAAGLIAADL